MWVPLDRRLPGRRSRGHALKVIIILVILEVGRVLVKTFNDVQDLHFLYLGLAEVLLVAVVHVLELYRVDEPQVVCHEGGETFGF